MTFDQFQTAVAALPSIPDGERARALAVAKQLPDGDRLEFFRYLKGFDGELEANVRGEERDVSGLEDAVAVAERRDVRFDREGKEREERAGKISDIETQFSPPSHGR